MSGLGMPELIVIFLIVFLVFGAGKLPQIGSSIGTAIREFKKSLEAPPKDVATAPPEETVCRQCRRPLQGDWLACPHCGTKRAAKPGA